MASILTNLYKDELCIRYTISKSIFYKALKYGVPAKNISQDYYGERKVERDFSSKFTFKCYPNGDCRKNRGYISLKFDEDVTNSPRAVFLTLHKSTKPLSLIATCSLLDREENLRFPESFAVIFSEDRIDNRGFGLGRYIKRSTLLDSDVFREDYLVVLCELKYRREEVRWVLPFSYRSNTFYIREKKHRLWSILRKKSPFFQKVIIDGNTELHSLTLEDCNALNILLTSIKTSTEPTFNDVNDAFDLYTFSDYALLLEYKQKCSEFLKTNMEHDFAFNVIALADMHSDADLKKYAIRYVLKYWKSKEILKNFKILKQNRPDLAKEVINYEEIEETLPIIETVREIENQLNKITIEKTEKEKLSEMVIEETEEVNEHKSVVYFEFYHL